jgi:glycosyltransferase involved in cell wall biosynthesis
MNTESKTILVVVPSLAGGGAERAVSWLTREWSKDHRVVTVVFTSDGAVYPFGGTLTDLRAQASSSTSGQIMTLFRRVVRLRRLIRTLRPDRIFGFTESANIPLLLAALSAGVPHRVTVSIRNNPNRMPWFHRLFVASLYVMSGRIALVSRGAAGAFVRMFPWAASRVRVLHSPLPREEIRDLSGQPVDEALLPPGAPYLFAAGRLVPGKDFARLIDLFAALRAIPDLPDLLLLIAGEGPEQAALQARIEARGLTRHARLLGRIENPFALMRGARAFLMTSRHEGFPMVLIEAMACGCPVIAFDCDFGPAEAVGAAGDAGEGGPGYAVPLHDDAAFVARMRQLASDAALRERMGAAARARASGFDAAVIAARWLESAPAQGAS